MPRNLQMVISTELMETAIDNDGAHNILIAMELVLQAKAEHIRETWGDISTAKVYDSFAQRLAKLSHDMEERKV